MHHKADCVAYLNIDKFRIIKYQCRTHLRLITYSRRLRCCMRWLHSGMTVVVSLDRNMNTWMVAFPCSMLKWDNHLDRG